MGHLVQRPVFIANFVYNLPFFRTQKGLVGKVLGGWEISGVTYFNTDAPNTLTTIAGTDPAALGILGPSVSSPRPDMGCNPNSGAPNTRFHSLNPARFQNS